MKNRKKLIETIENSIVYKNKGIGEKVIKKLHYKKKLKKQIRYVKQTKKVLEQN